MKRYLLASVLILLAIGAILFAESKKNSAPLPSVLPSEPASSRVTVGIGQTGSAHSLSVTPLSILEDSRCPQDVQCIQAGTVRVDALLKSAMGEAKQTFILGQTITTEAENVTLVEVWPAKVSTQTVLPAEYQFVFEITKR